LVFGSGSVAFGTLHDGHPFDRANAPPPFPAALIQDYFEGRKSIRHSEGPQGIILVTKLTEVNFGFE
jgi:hypothetical protein